MLIYNTLSRKKEELKKKSITFYTCGPTVYDYAHIGNFRTFVSQDLLKRYLIYKGSKVKHVMNITDVDDKIVKACIKNKVSLKEYTKKFTDAFFEDLKYLRIIPADMYPKATENIDEMVSMIQKLIEKGIAYKADDGSVYYNISKFPDYGKLAHIDVSGLKAGARVNQDEYAKENAQDFALWKAWDKNDGNVFWETPLGKGRPGWHIECSAMSSKYLGIPIDIHAGGVDLVFPHHENEIAQAEPCFSKKFANIWVHTEHLLVNGKKMSKSLGNFYALRDLLPKYSPVAIRYLLMSVHYRQQLNFTLEALEAAGNAVERINNIVQLLREHKEGKENKEVKKIVDNATQKIEESLDDDLEISPALAAVFDAVKDLNTIVSSGSLSKKDADYAISFFEGIDTIFGILEEKTAKVPKEIAVLVAKREKMRIAKKWKEADEIRNEIESKGFVLLDTPQGPVVRKK